MFMPVTFDPQRVRANVPACLSERAQWVCWIYIVRDGKKTKCPISPTNGGNASSTDPATWSTFEQALAACRACAELEGVGFVFSADDPFAGVDLDNCIDLMTGRAKPWAQVFLGQLDSYSEVSPSGTGVKMFVRASKPGPRCKTTCEDGAVEIYGDGRFYTFTGHSLHTPAKDVEERQGPVDAIYAQLFQKRTSSGVSKRSAMACANPAALTDDEIIRIARKAQPSGPAFSALWSGTWEGTFGSQSEADSSLVFRITFYTKDAAQIDRIFRQSGLFRSKWDEPRGESTYGQATIEHALAMVDGQYQLRAQRRTPLSASSGSASCGPDSSARLGVIDPDSGRLVLSVERTLPTARAYVEQFHTHPDGITLRHFAGVLMRWDGSRYLEIEDGEMHGRLLPWLHAAQRMVYDPKSKSWELRDFPANPSTVKSAIESIRAHTHLSSATACPCWLSGGADRPLATEIVPCRTSLLHLPTLRTLTPTPAFFCINALDFDYLPNAAKPVQWLAFIDQLFEGDVQSQHLLQEWFGYCLTGDTSQQKMLLIVGPRRSGKGTIGRVLTRLVGAGNVAGPTTSSLAGPFGLQPLIGKSLAIVSDARFSGDGIQTVSERLLCISGEDTLTVDRKHMTSVTLKLPTRFAFLTNELPRLNDSSGALAGRFVMLRLARSFFGNEDRTLTERLLTELPGILNWSIDGWQRLHDRGHFEQPESVDDLVRDMEDLSSPVGAFVRDHCTVGIGRRVWIDDLYQAWKAWCEADGRVNVTAKQTFGRDLMAAVAGIKTRCSTNAMRFYEGIELKEVPV